MTSLAQVGLTDSPAASEGKVSYPRLNEADLANQPVMMKPILYLAFAIALCAPGRAALGAAAQCG